jgi:hypothetical protein
LGLRSLEKLLRPEIRGKVVEEAVQDYLDRSRESGRLLNPTTELKEPILSQGFSPAGLQDAIASIYRLRGRSRRRIKQDAHGNITGVEIIPAAEQPTKAVQFPNEDELVEMILAPSPKSPSRRERRLHRLSIKGQP